MSSPTVCLVLNSRNILIPNLLLYEEAMGSRKQSSVVLVLSLAVIWIALTIIVLTWGFRYDWPDFVHVDYGFPLVWATRTLSTIAGPADIWEVNITALSIDLLLWLGSMVAVMGCIFWIKGRGKEKPQAHEGS